MADLLIRGMEMPKDCYECFVCTRCSGGCELDGEYSIPERPDNCPLVEVPDHGRLIDADELERKGVDVYQDIVHCGYVEDTIWGFSREMIENADTIIPASKEGGE